MFVLYPPIDEHLLDTMKYPFSAYFTVNGVFGMVEWQSMLTSLTPHPQYIISELSKSRTIETTRSCCFTMLSSVAKYWHFSSATF